MHNHIQLRLSALCCLALGAALFYCQNSVQAADVPAARLSPEPKGHHMRRYQAFVRQAELPDIAITSETALAVGTAAKLDSSRLLELRTTEIAMLAGEFRVPLTVIAKVLERVSRSQTPSARQLGQELRTAVVDYRFLQREWQRYHPPQEGQQTKTDALQALQAGDIAKAWALYDGLGIPPAPAIAPPQPPTNLRVVATK